MRLLVAVAVLLMCGAEALASGGINCEAKDEVVTFDVGAGVSRGMGAAIFSFDGTVTIKDPKIAPDLTNTKFELDNVAQYWLDGEELRLRLYRERVGDKPHGYVELEILTKARTGDDDEGLYAGRYQLSTYDTLDENTVEAVTSSYEGKVSCFVE
ncbi:hypothetical protein ABMA32_21000 [Mesorhizobium sp. VNQ89]|uniref:hypothetical protein n=1 Tax=Mesorhizobium quangtriensis TaxID=3157709 RepID=UPI0032B83EE6